MLHTLNIVAHLLIMLHLSSNGFNTVNAAIGLFNRKSLRTFEKKGQEPLVYLSDHMVRDFTSASQEVTCAWSGPHQNSNIVAHIKYWCTANINLEIIWTAAVGLFYRKSLRTFKKKGLEPSVYLPDHMMHDVTSAPRKVTCAWSGPPQCISDLRRLRRGLVTKTVPSKVWYPQHNHRMETWRFCKDDHVLN